MMGHRDACCPDLCRRPVSEIGEFFRQLQRFECGRDAGAEQNQEGLDGMGVFIHNCRGPAAEVATQASGKPDLESILDLPFTAV